VARMSEQPDHLADNNAADAAGAMGAVGDATAGLTAALQRLYPIPSGNAPFLTFDAIARRVSVTPQAADEAAQFTALAADELAAADEWVAPSVDYAAHAREKEMTMTPYDTSDTGDTKPSTNGRGGDYNMRVAMSDTADARRDPDARPYNRVNGAAARVNHPPTRRHRFAQGLVAIAAAILIVGLLGAVLYNLGASQHKSPTGQRATPGVHYLGAKAKWQVMGQYPVDPYLNDQPEYFVSQSNPMIVYKAIAGNFVMQRSTDGGATWQNIALPQVDFPGVNDDGVSLTVSPVNTQILILTLRSGPENPNCPANTASASRNDTRVQQNIGGRAASQSSDAAMATQLSPKIPASGGYSCSFQYISGNGGASWSKAQLPDGVLVSDVTLQNVLDAHGRLIGSRLYSLASSNATRSTSSVLRLMSSLDGGLTWTFIDQSLYAQGWETYTFTATPTGSIVFVETTTTVGGNHTGEDLWRTSDAGAHWTELGRAPLFTSDSVLQGFTATEVAGKTLLYADSNNASLIANDGTPYAGLASAPNQVFVTADNGHRWQHAPMAGVTAGMDSPDSALGTLSNGASVFQFNKIRVTESGSYFTITYSDTTYYSWSPGANAWLQLTPSLDGEPTAQAGVQWLVPAHDGQPETIWVFITRGNTQYLEKCALS